MDIINEQATTTNKRFAISVGDIFTCKCIVCNLAYHLPNKQQVKNERNFSKCLLIYQRLLLKHTRKQDATLRHFLNYQRDLVLDC